jgi:hypothetical protein
MTDWNFNLLSWSCVKRGAHYVFRCCLILFLFFICGIGYHVELLGVRKPKFRGIMIMITIWPGKDWMYICHESIEGFREEASNVFPNSPLATILWGWSLTKLANTWTTHHRPDWLDQPGKLKFCGRWGNEYPSQLTTDRTVKNRSGPEVTKFWLVKPATIPFGGRMYGGLTRRMGDWRAPEWTSDCIYNNWPTPERYRLRVGPTGEVQIWWTDDGTNARPNVHPVRPRKPEGYTKFRSH